MAESESRGKKNLVTNIGFLDEYIETFSCRKKCDEYWIQRI